MIGHTQLDLSPIALWKVSPKSEANRGSQLETIPLGIPCSFTILSMYNPTRYSSVLIDFVGIKWATLVSRSTTTKMEFYFFCILGSFVIKLQVTHSYFQVDMAKGYNVLHSNPLVGLLQVLIQFSNFRGYLELLEMNLLKNAPPQCIILGYTQPPS